MSARAGAPAAFDRALLALILAQIGLHACMAGVRLAAPLQALRLGHSAWDVGVLMALFALAPIVLAMRAGRLTDRRGYHLPMRIAGGLTIAGGLVALVSGWAGEAGFALLCLAATLSGAGANFGLITSQTTAGRRAADAVDRRRIFSWLGLAPSLSNALGPVLAGVLIDAAGFPLAYAVLLLLPLVSLAVGRLVPAGAPSAPGAPGGPGGSAGVGPPVRAGTWSLLMAPGMRRLLAINGLLSAGWDLHTFVLPVLGHERGFSASAIGTVFGVFAGTVALVRLLIPVVAQHAREEQVLVAAMLWAGAIFFAYPFAGSVPAMALCAAALGLALGMVQPMIMSALHQLTPGQRHGEAIALRSMVINMSSTLMPLAFGAAGTALGPATLFWLMAAALGAGSWPARRVGRPRRSA